jgi:hypothetical protein
VVHETHRCKLFQTIQEQAPYGYVQEAMQGNKSAKFNKQWQKLDELTGKKRSEDAAKTRTAQDEAEALYLLPTDTARTRRRYGSAVKTFSK